jgi:hypothetical protein
MGARGIGIGIGSSSSSSENPRSSVTGSAGAAGTRETGVPGNAHDRAYSALPPGMTERPAGWQDGVGVGRDVDLVVGYWRFSDAISSSSSNTGGGSFCSSTEGADAARANFTDLSKFSVPLELFDASVVASQPPTLMLTESDSPVDPGEGHAKVHNPQTLSSSRCLYCAGGCRYASSSSSSIFTSLLISPEPTGIFELLGFHYTQLSSSSHRHPHHIIGLFFTLLVFVSPCYDMLHYSCCIQSP